MAIATMTRARNQCEAETLLTCLRLLDRLAIPVYVADDGTPGTDFAAMAGDLRNVRICELGGSLVERTRRSLEQATESGAEVVIYTEPDKRAFFETGIQPFLEASVKALDRAVVVASRDEASMATYPEMQRKLETTLNRIAGEFLGRSLDLAYGPLAFRSAFLRNSLSCLNDGVGWGWRTCLIARAVCHGESLVEHRGYFPMFTAPGTSDESETPRYRLMQFADSIRGLYEGLGGAPG